MYYHLKIIFISFHLKIFFYIKEKEKSEHVNGNLYYNENTSSLNLWNFHNNLMAANYIFYQSYYKRMQSLKLWREQIFLRQLMNSSQTAANALALNSRYFQ